MSSAGAGGGLSGAPVIFRGSGVKVGILVDGELVGDVAVINDSAHADAADGSNRAARMRSFCWGAQRRIGRQGGRRDRGGEELAGRPGRAMRLAARLMPPAAGRCWLAEAHSILFEVGPQQRTEFTRDYLWCAPVTILTMWAAEASHRVRALAGGRPPRRPANVPGEERDDAAR